MGYYTHGRGNLKTLNFDTVQPGPCSVSSLWEYKRVHDTRFNVGCTHTVLDMPVENQELWRNDCSIDLATCCFTLLENKKIVKK